jgi:hypothetical protein
VNATPDGAVGSVNYTFSVSAAGMFTIWGRVRAPSVDTNSFWVKVDNGAYIQWNNLPMTTAWLWDDVHDSAMADATMRYTLTQGMHSLSIVYREAGAGLDKLVVTSDAGLVPSGMGP